MRGGGTAMKKNRHNSGETLVEVMVSIVIFLLLIAVLQGSVSFCTKAQNKSRDIRNNTEKAIENYLKAERDGIAPDEAGDYTFSFKTSDNSTAFSVTTGLCKRTVTYNDSDGNEKSVTFYSYQKAAGGGSP